MTNFVKAGLEASCFRPDQILPETPELFEVAVAGRSNVGKSSLINALLNTKLAKTGSTPGKTRSVNFYNVETDAKTKFRLVDLPGYGYAARSRDERNEWKRLIGTYFRDRENLKLVCHLVDFRHGLMKNDRELQEYIHECGKNILVVFTKADKIAKGKWLSTRQGYVRDGLVSCDVPIITSSEKKDGVASLRDFIAGIVTLP